MKLNSTVITCTWILCAVFQPLRLKWGHLLTSYQGGCWYLCQLLTCYLGLQNSVSPIILHLISHLRGYVSERDQQMISADKFDSEALNSFFATDHLFGQILFGKCLLLWFADIYPIVLRKWASCWHHSQQLIHSSGRVNSQCVQSADVIWWIPIQPSFGKDRYWLKMQLECGIYKVVSSSRTSSTTVMLVMVSW